MTTLRPPSSAPHDLQPGDLLFFYGNDLISRAIEWGTWWGARSPSHVAGIFRMEGRPVLLESTTLCTQPCLIQGKIVKGVQAHDPVERVRRYPGSVVRVPISKREQLDPVAAVRLKHLALELIGEPYDLAGALESGPRLFKATNFLPYPDMGSVFCSALWAWLLMKLCLMPRDNPKRYNPGDLLRAVRRNATHDAPQPYQP